MKRLIACFICFLMLSCQPKTDSTKNLQLDRSDSLTIENKIDTLLNTSEYLILGETSTKVKVVSESEYDNFPGYEVMIGFGADVILGENTYYDSLEIYKKYKPRTKFEDYPATIYEGKLEDPDFSTHPDAKRFITRIKNGCEEGINFAGYFTLITWGCGSPCQSGVVVNRKTGEIFGGYGTALGSEFRKNSNMLIRNVEAIDTVTNLIKACAYCEVNHDVWTGTEFEVVE